MDKNLLFENYYDNAIKAFGTDEEWSALEKYINNIDQKSEYVRTTEYEDWIYNFLLKNKQIDNFQLEYESNLSKDDKNMVSLLSYYWDYNRDKYGDPEDEIYREFGNIEGFYEFSFSLKNKKCRFERQAGCGCYVHCIELLN